MTLILVEFPKTIKILTNKVTYQRDVVTGSPRRQVAMEILETRYFTFDCIVGATVALSALHCKDSIPQDVQSN